MAAGARLVQVSEPANILLYQAAALRGSLHDLGQVCETLCRLPRACHVGFAHVTSDTRCLQARCL